MEHLLNCHGEITALLALIGGIPVVGVWFRLLLAKVHKEHGHGDT